MPVISSANNDSETVLTFDRRKESEKTKTNPSYEVKTTS